MFLDAIVLVLHVYYCVLLEKQIFKSSKWGRLQDPVMGRLGDEMIGRFEDVHGTSVIHAFKIQLGNLLWQVTQDFIVNCSCKKFSEQYSD